VVEPDERSAELHRLVGLDQPRYRRADVARLAGIEHERSVKWWRAMGFPEVPEDVCGFDEADLEMVRRLAALSGAGPTVIGLVTGEDDAAATARATVVAQAAGARLAEMPGRRAPLPLGIDRTGAVLL
jgi:hypothetical protein